MIGQDGHEGKYPEPRDDKTGLTLIPRGEFTALVKRALERSPDVLDRLSPDDQFMQAVWRMQEFTELHGDGHRWRHYRESATQALRDAAATRNIELQLAQLHIAQLYLQRFEIEALALARPRPDPRIAQATSQGGKARSARYQPLRDWCRAQAQLSTAERALTASTIIGQLHRMIGKEFDRQAASTVATPAKPTELDGADLAGVIAHLRASEVSSLSKRSISRWLKDIL